MHHYLRKVHSFRLIIGWQMTLYSQTNILRYSLLENWRVKASNAPYHTLKNTISYLLRKNYKSLSLREQSTVASWRSLIRSFLIWRSVLRLLQNSSASKMLTLMFQLFRSFCPRLRRSLISTPNSSSTLLSKMHMLTLIQKMRRSTFFLTLN